MPTGATFGTDLARVIAPNPSPFTAGGTNTWLLGRGEICVIDPGPDDPGHLAALLRALDGRKVVAIIVTHAHRDHSGLAPALSAATGAKVMAFGDARAGRRAAPEGIGGGEGVDEHFAPDRLLPDGAEVLGEGWRRKDIHTPGHMGNHLCLDDGTRLWTGDHAMGFATSVISPPDGDMGDYMSSMARLLRLGQRRLFPGHGEPIEDGQGRLRALLAHRRTREAEVLAAIAQGSHTAKALALRIYAGLEPSLRGAAERNVLAHLLQLSREGQVEPLGPPSADTAFRRV